jgi:peptidoglycan/LPS O-acetylase OafA/YrhL
MSLNVNPQKRRSFKILHWAVVAALFSVGFVAMKRKSTAEFQAAAVAMFPNISGIIFSWLIVLFESSPSEFINHKLWKSFGRLTYCFYLIHPIILCAALLCRSEVIDFNLSFVVSFD